MAVRVKVCCIASEDEVALALAHGASALGFVSAMPSGPGVVDEARIAPLVARVPRTVPTFFLTSECDPARIAEQVRRAGASVVQLCDRLSADAHRTLRALVPGVALVQVVHVTGEAALAEAREAAETADALLLDSGDPSLPVKELGGTGRVHDWTISRRIRDAVDVPVWLAGGLTPENVGDAIQSVAPHGVDVCSGLRTNGRLDAAKLARFCAAVAKAGAPAAQPA